MLLSGLTVYGLTYVLPTLLGGQLEYYFLELVAIILQLTVCVIFTSLLMDFFERRDRHGARGEHEVGASAGGERNNSNDEDGNSVLAMLAQIANTTFLMLMMLGCKFSVHCCYTADEESGYNMM